MEKEPKIEKKPTLKYEKPVLVDLTSKQASGYEICQGGSFPFNNEVEP